MPISCFPIWLILFHSELPGVDKDSYSSMVASSSWDTFQHLHIRAADDPDLVQHEEAVDPLELGAVEHVEFHNRRMPGW